MKMDLEDGDDYFDGAACYDVDGACYDYVDRDGYDLLL
jgi:hypothetical protein